MYIAIVTNIIMELELNEIPCQRDNLNYYLLLLSNNMSSNLGGLIDTTLGHAT